MKTIKMVHIKKVLKTKQNKTGRTDWTGSGGDREHGGHTVLQPTEHMAWMDQSLS